jgi:hypothetical protein
VIFLQGYNSPKQQVLNLFRLIVELYKRVTANPRESSLLIGVSMLKTGLVEYYISEVCQTHKSFGGVPYKITLW